MDNGDVSETEKRPEVVGFLQGRPEDAGAIAAWAGEMIRNGFEVTVRRLPDNTIEGVAF